MRRRLPPLSALRAFEAAARNGSFKRAAEELAVTPTAISHQIRSLEDHLGLRLFDRGVRQASLTEAGAELFPVLRDGFDSFDAVVRRLGAPIRRRHVTISATRAFTAKWLVPRLGRFRTVQPDIDLRLHASDEAVDLNAGAADVAIRYGHGPYPELNADILFADLFAPVANPVLGVTDLGDLNRVPLIHFRWQQASPLNPTWRRWFEENNVAADPDAGQLSFSDEAHAIQATVAGQGIALLSLALVQDELAAGQLVEPFGPRISGHVYRVLTRADAAADPAVGAVVEWLRAEARTGGAVSPGE